MNYSKIIFGMVRSGLFFFAILFAYSCTQPKEVSYPTSSSWNGGFLFKYRTFGFGSISPQSKSDPIFSKLQLKERIEKEIRYQFEGQNLVYNANTPDSFVFYYFVDDSLKVPILPYQYGSLQPEQYSIEIDTLGSKQSIFVLDLVDSGTMQLAWRSFAKITIQPSDSLFSDLPPMIEALIKRYPG